MRKGMGRPGRRRAAPLGCEGLEPRALLAAAPNQVVFVAATTLDSKGVTVTYQVEGTAPAEPIALAVDRSATTDAGPGSMPVGTATISPAQLDLAGQPATAPGEHVVTVPLAGGLPDNPEHPYVVVVANPDDPSATEASFRVFTIAVIVHGGDEASSADTYGPGWEPRLAHKLRAEGYDFVIPFVWASKSRDPAAAGAAGPQTGRHHRPRGGDGTRRRRGRPPGDRPQRGDGHRLARPPGPPTAPALAAGWIDLTLLDPYPATNHAHGPQWSADTGLINDIVHGIMDTYQGWAHDPVPFIPANVDLAQVYYQKTPVDLAKAGLVNFWGRVPVAAAPGVPVEYADLTGPGVSHSGDFDVRDWYWFHIVPLLGDGPAFSNPGLLTAAPAQPAANGLDFSGTAFPGASVGVFALTPGSHTPVGIGRATADAQGNWSLDAAPGSPVVGRFFARSAVAAFPGARRTFVMHTVRIFAGDT